MLDHERETVRTLGRHPGLFVGGALAAVAWLVVQVAVAIPVMLVTLPRNTQPVFALPLANAVSMLVLPPVLAGLYAVTRQGRTGDDQVGIGGSLPRLLRTCAQHARDLVVATMAFRAAAIPIAAVVFVLLLAGDTAHDYWRYAGGDVGPVVGPEELVYVWLYAMVAGAIGRLTLAFYDLPVLFGDAASTRGWRAGLRFARRCPRALLRYGAGRLLLWSPMLAVLLLEIELLLGEASVGDPLTSGVVFVAAGAVVGTVTTTLTAVHHVVVYEWTVEPALTETAAATPAEPDARRQPGGVSTAAVALAVLLVTAAGAGTVAIRVGDARPMPATDVGPVDETTPPGDVVRNAERAVAASSHRSVTRSYRVDGESGERTLVMEYRIAIDRADRRIRLAAKLRGSEADEWQRTVYYASEATMAMNFPGDAAPDEVPVSERFVGRTAVEWGVMYVPGYVVLDGASASTLRLDAERADWEVGERTDDAVVVGYTRQPVGEQADDPPDDGDRLASEQARLIVDRDTGRPTRLVENRTYVEYENGNATGRYWTVKEVRFEDYGDPGVDRPDAIGPRGPVEWLWDLVYY